ncbi:hypothetical protein EIK77_004401 [Talaromyces pinophilus]|nr:hypothetical protein EIK77_004401 [Talaromyces pinophilus]
MGKSAASQSASSLRSTFPNIELALVVGICADTSQYDGGNNIFLGDVVISEGISSYEDEGEETKERLTGKIVNYLKIIDDNLWGGSAQYPGISQDELFQPNYVHKHYKPGFCSNCNHNENSIGLICDNASDFTCEQLGCQKENLIARERLKIAAEMDKPPTPVIHIGLVGSADAVMKSGLDRDRIASRDKVLVFEMEGAGVWDVLPGIIIKGVSDYADSHKNKVWQRYAAATGAACMRAVLELWMH